MANVLGGKEKKGTDGIFQFWGEERLTTPFVQKIGKILTKKRASGDLVRAKMTKICEQKIGSKIKIYDFIPDM